MTETNHASEAAASSPSPYLTEAMLRAQANPDCAFPDAVQVLSQEVLRMRAQCPPTAEVEKLRAELATAKDDVKRLRDEKRDQIAATVEHLRRAGIIVGSPTAGPTPGVAIGEPMTLASTIGMLCDERAKILASLGREAKALLEASFMLRCAEGGRPLPAPRVEETFGIFEALRKVIAERDALISAEAWAQQMGRQAQDATVAWKHKADTLGGDLNRIRSLVPTASDEQTTFDAVQAELLRLRSELTQFRQAIGLMTTAKPDMQVDANDPIGMARQVVELVERLRRDGLTALNSALEQKKRAETAEALAERNGKAATERGDRIRQLHDDLATIRAALVRCGRAVGGKMADDVSLEFLGYIPAEVERVVERMRAELAASEKRVAELGCSLAMTPKSALTEEAQTAIAAMRDVGPELAKAGIQVGPRCSHAEAVAQLRGERDRWREKCEGADKEAGSTARWILATCDRLAGAGFDWTGAKSHEAGLHNAVNAALAELARLRKESKRDQVGKQQALLDEIARLVPGKGTLLGRVQKAANGYIWRERLLRLRDGIKAQLAWCTLPGGAPFAGMHEAHAALSCALRNADALMAEAAGLTGDWCGTNRPEMPPLAPKVGPATGQPRTEVPLAADGSGTVLNLGEAFRKAIEHADPDFFGSPRFLDGKTDEESRYRHLYRAVAELAKVVERMGAR